MQARNPSIYSNRSLTAADLHRHGQFKADGLTLWERVIEQRRLTTRSSLQLLRVASTIADLNRHDMVQTKAISDASGYRCTDLMGDHSAGAVSR
jgi:magnesium chelatase family protein